MQEGLGRFYEKMVEYQKRHLWLMLFLLTVITGFFLFFAVNLQVDSTLDQQLKPGDNYLSLRDVISKEFGDTESFFVVIRVDEDSKDKGLITDLRDPEVIRAIEVLEESMLRESEVKNTISIASFYKRVFGRLPSTLQESKEFMKLAGSQAEGFYKKDMSATIINAGVDIPLLDGAREDTEERLKKRIEDAPLPLGIEATLTGIPTLLNQIINLMINDSIRTMLLALGFVFIVLLFLFRRFSLALITIAPVIMAIIWLAGTLTLLGVKLSFANATVAAMVIGLGVDYAIHITNSFDVKVRKHSAKPITETMKVVGAALFISFLTTLVGFSVNMLGSTAGIRIQGLTLAIGVTYSFVCTMLLIPLLLKLKIDVLREEFGKEKWKSE